jgi:hypothetical protein
LPTKSEAERILDNKRRWAVDIVAFSKEVFPHYIQPEFGVPQFHRQIYREYLLDDPSWYRTERQIVIRAPRGFSKTTTAVVYTLYCILFEKKHYIIVLSDSGRKARDTFEKVKHELESNQIIRTHFGPQHIRLTKDEFGKWRQNEFVTSRSGIRMISLGITQGVRGTGHWQYRPDLIIGDDIEGERNTTTPELRKKSKDEWFRAVLQAVDDYRGQLIYLYTPVHEDCLGLQLEEMSSWRSLKWGCYTQVGTERGPLLWSKRFPKKLLDKKKKELVERYDLEGWAMEYLCDVAPPETAIFKRDWIQDYDGEYFWDDKKHWIVFPDGEKKHINVYVGVDLATGRKTKQGSQTAFVVIGVDEENHVWVLETIVGKPNPSEMIELFFKLDTEYNKPQFSVEENSFQYFLYGDGGFLQREQVTRNQGLNFGLVKDETEDKDDRIESLHYRFKCKSVHARSRDTEFILAFVRYRPKKSKRNDIADAFHKAVRIARRPTPLPPKPDIDPFYLDRMKYPERYGRRPGSLWTRAIVGG